MVQSTEIKIKIKISESERYQNAKIDCKMPGGTRRKKGLDEFRQPERNKYL